MFFILSFFYFLLPMVMAAVLITKLPKGLQKSARDISVATSIFYTIYALLNGANSHVRAIPNDQLIGVVSFTGDLQKLPCFLNTGAVR